MLRREAEKEREVEEGEEEEERDRGWAHSLCLRSGLPAPLEALSDGVKDKHTVDIIIIQLSSVSLF